MSQGGRFSVGSAGQRHHGGLLGGSRASKTPAPQARTTPGSRGWESSAYTVHTSTVSTVPLSQKSYPLQAACPEGPGPDDV